MVHLPFDDADHNHPSQMPDRCHHDPHVEGELICTGLLEEIPFEEHARPLAELNHGACAFRAVRQVADHPSENIERVTRRLTGAALASEKVIPGMIERIKALIEGRD